MVQQVQRQRLCDAIAGVAGEHGYRETTVHKVVTRARISRRTFYELFADLDDCFLAAYVETTDEVLAKVEEGCGDGPPEQRIASGLDALLGFFAGEPQLARVCVVEALAAGTATRDRRAETMERLTAMLAAALDEREAEEPTPHLRAQVLVGGIHELIYDRISRGDFERLPELAGEVMASLLGTPRGDG